MSEFEKPENTVFDQLRAHGNKGIVAAVLVLLSYLGITENNEDPVEEPPVEAPSLSITLDQCKAVGRGFAEVDARLPYIQQCKAKAGPDRIVVIDDKEKFCEELANSAFDSSSQELVDLFREKCSESGE